jgi:hypothetical protein
MDKKELWVNWTRDAQSRYQIPEDIEDQDALVDDMVDVATKYADSMLDEYEKRFDGSGERPRKGKRKPVEED